MNMLPLLIVARIARLSASYEGHVFAWSNPACVASTSDTLDRSWEEAESNPSAVKSSDRQKRTSVFYFTRSPSWILSLKLAPSLGVLLMPSLALCNMYDIRRELIISSKLRLICLGVRKIEFCSVLVVFTIAFINRFCEMGIVLEMTHLATGAEML